MPKENKPAFNIHPYHLNEQYKNSYTEVSQHEMPEFFKQLSKFMKKNPHLTLEDLRMSYTHYAPDFGSIYVIEGVWVDESEEVE